MRQAKQKPHTIEKPMPSPYKMFKTNPELECSGIELNYGDFRITIARAGGANKKFAKAIEKKSRPFKRAIQSDSFDNERAQALLKEVYAETVVLGWDGVTDEKGEPLPFNRENCLKLFNDLPDLFQDIMEQAQKSALFREEIRENDAGN